MPPDPDLLANAVQFAAIHHGDQRRKDANRTSYVSHLLAVCSLALEDGGSQDHAIAAILHDTIEDCPTVTSDLLETEFGPQVLHLVAGCTDFTPSDGAERPPWRDRKLAYVEHLRSADDDVLLVSNADKLHNLSSLVADIETSPDTGSSALGRFNDPSGVMWYYSELDAVFAERRAGTRNQVRFAQMLDRLRSLV